jgi:hypothetical protein
MLPGTLWASESLTEMIVMDLGPIWDACVLEWTSFEGRVNWKKDGGSFPTKARPKDFGAWLKKDGPADGTDTTPFRVSLATWLKSLDEKSFGVAGCSGILHIMLLLLWCRKKDDEQWTSMVQMVHGLLVAFNSSLKRAAGELSSGTAPPSKPPRAVTDQ